MQKTTNYNLNQWDATDRVTRADFNADNQRIDSAIKSAANAAATAQSTANSAAAAAAANVSPWVKLIDYTLAADASQLVINMSGIDLNQYAELRLYPTITLDTGTMMLMTVNGRTAGYYTNGNGSANSISTIASAQGSTYYTAVRLYYNGKGLMAYNTRLDLTSHYVTIPGAVNLNSQPVTSIEFGLDGSVVKAGSRVLIYGLKK